MQKWERNAKNEKYVGDTLRHFFRISQHFVPGSAFARRLKGFRGLFFCGINKKRNSPEMRNAYNECFAFYGVFRENIREMRNTKSV